MKFVKPTKEQKDFIPTPLATYKGIKTIGVGEADNLQPSDHLGIADTYDGVVGQLVSVDYVANADDVNAVEECGIKDEMEPSTANIVVNKLKTVGNDFASFDPRVLRGE